jgi:PhnB protein
MALSTTTHLNFRGDARRALEFYQSVFGGELMIATYGDFGMPAGVPGAELVVFGQVESANGFRVMAYDIPGETAVAGTRPVSTRRENGTTVTDEPFFVSVRGDSLVEVQRHWDALAQDATLIEPLSASAWSAGFGMLTDRFGVTWILDVAQQPA